MSQNTLQNDQNNQNDHTFTEFNNLQSTVIQPGHSSNINYNDVNANSSDNNFPTFYTDTNYSDQTTHLYDNIHQFCFQLARLVFLKTFLLHLVHLI
ncbi:hypothetical protein GLOIN_2v1876629 [Rhizophagus irregularis DAOM 181602=DAOM 197198]|nr:hypothetical protein GLOIN_2v1876629 [Rhizophagus irregularis DAOM 181602=DAOM 197198]